MDRYWHLAYLPTYLYVVACKNDAFYVGITHDLELRLGQHMTGHSHVLYTEIHGVSRVVTAIIFPDRESALIAEKFVTYYFKVKRQSTFSDEDVEAFLDHYYPNSKHSALKGEPDER